MARILQAVREGEKDVTVPVDPIGDGSADVVMTLIVAPFTIQMFFIAEQSNVWPIVHQKSNCRAAPFARWVRFVNPNVIRAWHRNAALSPAQLGLPRNVCSICGTRGTATAHKVASVVLQSKTSHQMWPLVPYAKRRSCILPTPLVGKAAWIDVAADHERGRRRARGADRSDAPSWLALPRRGFGALDPHALDEAMTELERQAESGRLIGVISHVQAVTEYVDDVLQVTRLPTGSEVRRLDRHEAVLRAALSVGGEFAEVPA